MNSIIVHDVKELEKYYERLKEAKKDLEDLLEKLNSDCRDQNRNWEDGQYREFEDKLTEFTDAVNDQMEDALEDAMDIVSNLLRRLQ